MDISQQIGNAIGAHGLWKSRLRAAITNGAGELKAATVRDDHQCEFGKWLYSPTLEAAVKQSKHYATCADLHHRFHAAASEIVALIAAGKKEEAGKKLEGDFEFKKLSAELTMTMMAWKSGKN